MRNVAECTDGSAQLLMECRKVNYTLHVHINQYSNNIHVHTTIDYQVSTLAIYHRLEAIVANNVT